MKKLLLAIILLVVNIAVMAHAPILSVDDNKDGTIYIEGGFSNGESAEGVEIIIVKDRAYNGPEETYEGKLILFKGVLDKNNSLIIIKPFTQKYEVIFDGGLGHTLSKKGPLLEENEIENWKKEVEKASYLGEWKEKMTTK